RRALRSAAAVRRHRRGGRTAAADGRTRGAGDGVLCACDLRRTRMKALASRTPHPTFRLRESPPSPSRGEGDSVDVSAHEPPSPPEGLRGGGAATNRSGGAIGAEEGSGVRGTR